MSDKYKTLAVVSGGFDPVHVGHLELFNKARQVADELHVIVNNDNFLKRKKIKPFMGLEERMAIIEAFKAVDEVVESIDEDDTVCATLAWLVALNKSKYEEIYFCNGGDRTDGTNTPEHQLCEELGINSVYGLGDKIQSSSWLLENKPNLIT